MYKSDYITSWLEISPFPPGKAKVWRVKTKNDYDTFQPDKKMKSKGNILAFFFFPSWKVSAKSSREYKYTDIQSFHKAKAIKHFKTKERRLEASRG